MGNGRRSKAQQHEVVAQTVTFMPKRQDSGAGAESPMHDDAAGYEMSEEGS